LIQDEGDEGGKTEFPVEQHQEGNRQLNEEGEETSGLEQDFGSLLDPPGKRVGERLALEEITQSGQGSPSRIAAQKFNGARKEDDAEKNPQKKKTQEGRERNGSKRGPQRGGRQEKSREGGFQKKEVPLKVEKLGPAGHEG